MKLVLASGSPRRQELLAASGLTFEVEVSSIEEVRGAVESTEDYVRRLASQKAEHVSTRSPDSWVIGADTVVWIDGAILEKPRDTREAVSMLQRLTGNEHIVYTGVALRQASSAYLDVTLTTSKVRMLPLSLSDIEWYVATGEPLDKAGSYAVQGIGGWFIESIEGSYTNVVGLPLHALFMMMRRAGLDPLRDFRT